ncbi:hypothetical protein HMPREF3156_02111 [Neisseria sp. HMSC06F02]|nr:hypothetical protein HMPREF3156_02111 [Neisseria sp. HMSC06F02]
MGDGQNILIFVGKAYATVSAGVLFKSIIKRSSENKSGGFL